MKIFLLTGPEYPIGHPDDQKLCLALQSLKGPSNVHWLNWRKLSFSRGPADGTPAPVSGDLVLIRTPWDYQSDAKVFLQLLAQFEAQGVQLMNPFATIRWNLDKLYLLELESSGVSIVPTYAWAQPQGQTWQQFVKVHTGPSESGQGDWVLKPRIGASASGVQKLRRSQIEPALVSLNAEEMLLQPMIPSVATTGEISMIFYHIQSTPHYSHAVLKCPRQGDFRVQADWGGSEAAFSASETLIQQSCRLLERLPQKWVYARVDWLDFHSQKPLLGEVELIEPQLFHRFGESSEELLIEALSL